MSIEDIVENQLEALDKETENVMKDVMTYQRRLYVPIWEKRREMGRKIPNFWGIAIGNYPVFSVKTSENDVEALDSLIDFHVEFDEAKPDYRKVTATFKKNRVFKNETLIKEFNVNLKGEGSLISKSTIEYHADKTSNKRKADALEDDGFFNHSFLEWFGDEEIDVGAILTDEIFPNAVDYYKGTDEDEDDDEDDEEIDLDLESEEEEEEEAPKAKKSRK
ncbi:unnamed protein product [Rhizopus stolonifer]